MVSDSSEKLNRNFLWGHNAESNLVHLVGWDRVMHGRSKGGLGIKSSRLMNHKGWKLSQERERSLYFYFEAQVSG